MDTQVNRSSIKPVKALVVDDEKHAIDLLSEMLKTIGVEKIITAKSAESALNLFQTERPDIVFSDIMLIKISGLSLLRKLKAIDKNVPVILLSGFHEYRRILENSDVKPDNFLEKPLNIIKIKKVILDYFPHLG